VPFETWADSAPFRAVICAAGVVPPDSPMGGEVGN
jgi:hypothetical protein